MYPPLLIACVLDVCSNDSLHNTEILKRGDLQMTSTGTGIRHSEHSHGDKQVHFLQIWVIPSEKGLQPQYYTRCVSLLLIPSLRSSCNMLMAG